MLPLEFLRVIFPRTEGQESQFVRFVVVDGKTHDWPGAHHFRTISELHALDGGGINALGFDTNGKDVYFTPHAFQRRDMRLTKIDAAPVGSVAWVELDDDDIPPETFTPLPSITVESSPGRYHLYWLLAEPLAATEIERLNYRLTYGNRLKRDRGGWDIIQLLRVPGSVSYKRSTPHAITITHHDLSRVYNHADFDDLPPPPDVLSPSMARPLPSEESAASRDELRHRYDFTRELDDLLDRELSDRSKAMWRIYSICYRIGMTEEDCYALVKGTPNDKFTSWRYNGLEGLWQDILRGFHMAHNPEETPIQTRLRGVRSSQGMPAAEKRRQIAQLVVKDLSEHGRIYFDPVRRDALFFDGRHVIPIDDKNRRWKALLNLRYHVAEGESEFKPVNANIYAIATEDGEPVTPRTFAYWNRDDQVLYVYNGGGVVYRLDGTKIEEHQNGIDGVLFRDTGFTTPFLATPPKPDSDVPTIAEAVVGLPNYVDVSTTHTREQAVLLARIWLFSLFFAEHMDARPHLIIVGPTDSGKTSAYNAISELLSGPNITVSSLPNDRQTFETNVSNAQYIFYDNVDDATWRRWLIDAIAEVATGMQFTRRVLYTNNEAVTFRVQCFLGMTTRYPWFARTDIATRLIPLETERRERKINPTALFDRVRRFRAELWWELLTDLNRIVAVLDQYTAGEHSLRMAGYADFIEAACDALDFPLKAKGLIRTIQERQTNTALDQSILWDSLDKWVRDINREGEFKNNDEWTSTTKIYNGCCRIAEENGEERAYKRQIPNVKSFAAQLRELVPDIRQVMDVEFNKKHPVSIYKFTVREEPHAA